MPVPGHTGLATASLLLMSSVRARGTRVQRCLCAILSFAKRWAHKLGCAITELGTGGQE